MTPRGQERVFKTAYAKELLRLAQGDLDSAKGLASLAEEKRGRAENICYLAHQAIEKALKAVLVQKRISVPLIHDLNLLVARLPAELNVPFGYEIGELNDYAAVRRYEEGTSVLTEKEIVAVIGFAETAVRWASALVPNR